MNAGKKFSIGLLPRVKLGDDTPRRANHDGEWNYPSPIINYGILP